MEVDPDPIFVRDGNVTSAAGVTAGMDLALALVEEDLGRAVALETALARAVPRAPRRAGAVQRPARRPDGRPRAAPRRNFARAFREETGLTPAAHVESARVEHARVALEAGDLPIETIARQAGFGTVETMRRAFRRRVGVSPGSYRSRFRPEAA